jgi:hypothetical protein
MRDPWTILRRRSRGPGLLATLALLLVVAGAPGIAAPVAAAGDQLDIRTATTYTLVPEAGVVRVVVDLRATNLAPSTTSGGVVTNYFFRELHLALQPEATRVRATSDGAALATDLTRQRGYRELAVRLRSNLLYRQAVRVRVTYDLPGGAPRSKSDIRVGRAYATFYAWVTGDVASVRIVIPASFEPTVTGSELRESKAGGSIVYTAEGITDAVGWYAIVDADRPAALTGKGLSIRPGQRVSVRGWPEDREWVERVSDRLTRGLPQLDELIGLPWPVSGDIEVREVHTPLLEGYSGIFRSDRKQIEISEDLDDLTILHEASHAWFNGGLFQGRWIGEGLANTYATKALQEIGIFSPPPYDYARSDAAAFPLNDWPPLARIIDERTQKREDYGYEASFGVVQALVTLAGDEAMRDVFRAASRREIPYVGAVPPETLPDTPDWRWLLDALQERTRGAAVEGRFRTWVVAESDLPRLDAREAARQAYAGLVAEGQGWLPPYAVRLPMATWDFATATARIAAGAAILARRDELGAVAASLGLGTPEALRSAYERASTDLAGVAALATAELDAVDAIAAAAWSAAAPRGPLETIGLLGQDPGASLEAAKGAFRADRLDAARNLAHEAVAVIDGATERGVRAVGVTVVLLALLILLALAVAVVRRRRRATRAVPVLEGATAATSASGPEAGTYGTLANQSSPETPGPDGEVDRS